MDPTSQRSPATAAAPPGASLLGAIRVFRRDEVVAILAGAYGDAAKRDADMRAAVDVLERVRAALVTEADPFSLWTTLDNQVGRSEAERLMPVVRQLRDECARAVSDRVIERVAEAFRRNAATGWALWVWAYARALQDGRDAFWTALTTATMPEPGEYAEKLDAMRRYARLMTHERWAECRDGLIMLSEQPGLDDRQRASLMSLVGQVHLMFLGDLDGASEWLDRAEGLAGDTLEVLLGRMRYWLAKEDTAKAAELARRAVEVAPGRQEGHMALGDCEEAAGNLEGAEIHCLEAISTASGAVGAYLQLIRLYGRTELYAARLERVPMLVARACAVDPASEYSLILAESWNDRRNGRGLEAIADIRRAIAMDPARLRGYLELGAAHLELADRATRPEEHLDEAEAAFAGAIKVAPEAYDGHWNMALLHERRRRWEEGLALCTTCLELQPLLESFFRSKRADFLRMLDRLPEAEVEVELALRATRSGSEPVQAMIALGDAYYQEKGDRVAARRLYRLTRTIRGEEFDAEYENLIGNLHYYYKEYATAAEAYRRAMARAPRIAVYHSNLAGALEHAPADDRLRRYDEIIDELREASRLAPGNREYPERIARIERRKRFLLRYGAPALELRPAVTPIQPVLEDGLLGAILDKPNENEALRGGVLRKIAEMRADLRQRFGVTIPGVTFTNLSGGSPLPGTYYLTVAGELKEEGRIPPGALFVPADDGHPGVPGLAGEPPEHTGEAPPPRGVWLDRGQADRARDRGLPPVSPDEFLLGRLQAVLESNLASLVDYQMTVDLLKQSAVAKRDEILKGPERIVALTRILKGLLNRQSTIADLDAIVEALDRKQQPGTDEDAIVEALAPRPGT